VDGTHPDGPELDERMGLDVDKGAHRQEQLVSGSPVDGELEHKGVASPLVDYQRLSMIV
jgi:hypothetical protein